MHTTMSKCTLLHNLHLRTVREFGLGTGGVAGLVSSQRLLNRRRGRRGDYRLLELTLCDLSLDLRGAAS